MNKKAFLFGFMLVFTALLSSYAYAFDVSIDRVVVNNNVVAESRQNLIEDADLFVVVAEITSLDIIEDAHVEAILRGRQSGDSVADATDTFDLAKGGKLTAVLALALKDSLKRETEFDLTIKVIDAKGNSEQKSFGIKTQRTRLRTKLDVSIDRVLVNNKVVAESRANFIERSNDFDVLVEFTALEDLEDSHVEVILKDLKSGNVVADATPNFDLTEDSSSSELLRLELLDKLKQSNSFELTVRLVDAEGNSVQKVYGIRMREKNGVNGISGGRVLDISIDSVELEGDVIAENENNFVVIDKGEKELGLRVRLTALENVEDAHVDAVLAFENGDVVADATTTFDINDGSNIVKELELPLNVKFEQSNFKLKVKITDAEGDTEEKVYGLKISQKKFPFVITSIQLNPESNAEAGKAIVVKLSFRNIGVLPLDGIVAKVSIPELGVSASKFISKTNLDSIGDFVLKIPEDAGSGTYTAKAEISSQFGDEAESKQIPVFIVGKAEQPKQVVNDKLVVNVPVLKQDLRNDDSEVIYPLMLTNQGPDANTYTLLLDNSGMVNLRLSESNVFIIKPKESKTINIYASSNTNAVGEHIFVATIKSDGKVLAQVPLKANIVAVKGLIASKLKNVLEVMLIGIVVLLVVAGVFFGVKRYLQGNSISKEIPDEEQGEAYY
ncbi:hypothetical protein HYX02_01330 [Candidatus Woesearchaeota archaeon]|nr:hypothetical protein [Candidatus Woesearchaeota archaeon]